MSQPGPINTDNLIYDLYRKINTMQPGDVLDIYCVYHGGREQLNYYSFYIPRFSGITYPPVRINSLFTEDLPKGLRNRRNKHFQVGVHGTVWNMKSYLTQFLQSEYGLPEQCSINFVEI